MTEERMAYPTVVGNTQIRKGENDSPILAAFGVVPHPKLVKAAQAGHRYLFKKPKPGGGYNYYYHDPHGDVVAGKRPEKGTKELSEMPHRIRHQHHENIYTRNQKRHKELVAEGKDVDAAHKHHKKKLKELEESTEGSVASRVAMRAHHKKEHVRLSERKKEIKEKKETARVKMDVAKMGMATVKREAKKKAREEKEKQTKSEVWLFTDLVKAAQGEKKELSQEEKEELEEYSPEEMLAAVRKRKNKSEDADENDSDIIKGKGVLDEDKWERAKSVVAKQKKAPKDKYALISHIYQQMGGRYSKKKSEYAMTDLEKAAIQ